jgi:ssDNA-binding replication factor A large subunit
MAAAAQFFPISELSAYQNKWTIKAKVTNKAPMRTFGSGGKVFSCEFNDNSGCIRASFFGEAATKFVDVVQAGKVYTVSKGTVKVGNKQYNNTGHKYELTFDKGTEVTEFTGEMEEIKTTYNFSTIKAVQSKQIPCRVDLCGVITNFRPVATVNAKDGRQLSKRDITIVDESSCPIELTLWAEHATRPDSDFEGKPVAAFKGLLIKEFGGQRVGGTIDGSVLEVKPDLADAKRIEQWWSQGGSKQSFANFTDLQALETKTLPCRVDLCGVITQVKPIQTVQAKDGRELVKRDLTIADHTNISMTVTLWGDHSQKPDSDFEGNPTIMLTSVLVKEWNGGRAGSTLEASTSVLKPDIPEAKANEQWWAQGGSSKNLMTLTVTGGGGGAAANAKRCTLTEMRASSEGVAEQTLYKVVARLSAVQTRKQGEKVPLVYKACTEQKEGQYGKLPCNRRVEESGHCPSCDRQTSAAWRLNTRCRFVDFADSAWMTSFHEAAEKVVGMGADKVAEVDNAEDGREKLEAALLKGYFATPLELTIRAKPETYNGEAKVGVTCISATPVNRREHGRRLLTEIQHMVAAA